MMPGMGLTAIGLAGLTLSYAGIAHTFIDGMHALTGLTMFVGLIFLAAGFQPVIEPKLRLWLFYPYR
jgi:hypothetical protein